ncbi:MAG: NHL repeat-containing protein [Polyangiaceae bacterium]|nr:NHL repeat-containing protein [Polyangiaceae bacterium]
MSPIRGIVFFTVVTLATFACTGNDPPWIFVSDQQEAGSDGSLNDVVDDAGNDAGDVDADAGSQYVVTTLAGTGDAGSADGPGDTATFNHPWGIAIGPDSSLYVGDNFNQRIRKVAINGTVSTYAGTGSGGYADNNCANATFGNPEGIAADKAGNVYVADASNHVIRKIMSTSTTCQVSTLAGKGGTAGSADGVGTEASFNFPRGLTVDTSGNVYVADRVNNKIRKVTPAGVVTTVAGSGIAGHTDGAAMSATFNQPAGIAVDATAGALYVAENNNNDIRKITFDGMGNPLAVSTLAGSGASTLTDGVGLDAAFNDPMGLAIDTNGNLYVADAVNCAIRIISPTAEVTTLAGTGKCGADDGPADKATFNVPFGVTLGAGIVYVTDDYNHKIRKIAPSP